MIHIFIKILLGILFLISGLSKIISKQEFLGTLKDLEIKSNQINLVYIILVLAELSIPFFLLQQQTNIIAEIIIFILGISFLAVTLKIRKSKSLIKCNCFGSLSSETFGISTYIKILLVLFFDTILILENKSEDSILDVPINTLIDLITISLGFIIIYLLLSAFWNLKSKMR